jgi:glycosyltransferase involved in cell wall biosynthesis
VLTGRPRIFVFSREYPPVTVGGTSTVARNLSIGLAAHGWQVVAVSTNPRRHEDEREHIDGVLVHRTGTGVVYNPGSGVATDTMLSHRRLHQAAVRLAAEFGSPAVVALPDLFCYPESALLARSARAPLVNILLQDFRTLTRLDRGRHQVTSGVSADPGHLLALEEKAIKGSAHVAFISQALADAVARNYPDATTEHSVIHLGVDTAEIASVAADDGERARLSATLPAAARGRPLLVGCGRLVPVKGFSPLLRAMALLGDRQPAPYLAIAGVGPQEARLRRLAADLGIAAQVSFLGDIPRRAALTWMSMADVAVVPSLWESFCYVCAEMMALGRPVVATAVDSLNELMPTEKYGFRVPVLLAPDRRWVEPAGLARAIGSALADPADAAARGMAARARILTQFTNARFARSVSDLCTRLRTGAADD